MVRLPVVPAPEEIVRPPRPSQASSERGANWVRVLVVDDNVDGCTLLAELVRMQGYGVQAAFTGPDGLAVASTWRPDAVLLDIGLPGLDGYEIARRLRADPATTGMKLFALTGYGSARDWSWPAMRASTPI